jgi:hypothetical protein
MMIRFKKAMFNVTTFCKIMGAYTRYPLILHMALSTWPVSAAIVSAKPVRIYFAVNR